MINLTITVDDISFISSIFTHIEIQRASDYDFSDAISLDLIVLSSVSTYYYNDVSGNASNWYRFRYINTSTLDVSDWSDPVRGEEVDYFVGATYPVEESYSSSQRSIINNIRAYIGDYKIVKREYVSDCYRDVMGDYYTYVLPNKGWPLKVRLVTSSETREYTSKSNPVVQGYRYVTFSGISDRITPNSTLDIWYESFNWSDKELYTRYSATDTVYGISPSRLTEEALIIYCSLNILELELQTFAREAAVRVEDGDTRYNPEPAIRARQLVIDNMKKKLDDILKNLNLNRLEGVLID